MTPNQITRAEAELAQLEKLTAAITDYQVALRNRMRSDTWRNGLQVDARWLDLLTAMNAVDGIDDALSDHIDIAREEVERNDPEGILDGEAA